MTMYAKPTQADMTLLPCPWHPHSAVNMKSQGERRHWAQCYGGCRGPACSSYDEAIHTWNIRPNRIELLTLLDEATSCIASLAASEAERAIVERCAKVADRLADKADSAWKARSGRNADPDDDASNYLWVRGSCREIAAAIRALPLSATEIPKVSPEMGRAIHSAIVNSFEHVETLASTTPPLAAEDLAAQARELLAQSYEAEGTGMVAQAADVRSGNKIDWIREKVTLRAISAAISQSTSPVDQPLIGEEEVEAMAMLLCKAAKDNAIFGTASDEYWRRLASAALLAKLTPAAEEGA